MSLRTTWRRLLEVTRGAMQHDITGEAAKIAYYFFLSLFPLVLILFALTGIIGGDAAFASITAAAARVVPQYGWQFVRDLISEVTDRSRPGVLSIGILLTLWAGSNGIAALTQGLNTIHGVPEGRGWWRRRAISIAVLVVGALSLVIGTAALIFSTEWLRGLGFGPTLSILRWPFGFALIAGAMWLMYRYLPVRGEAQSPRATAAGALAATTLWIVAGLLLRIYVTHFSRYGRTYGTVGAVIVLLLWFYVTATVILFGAELAVALEKWGILERPLSGRREPAAPAAAVTTPATGATAPPPRGPVTPRGHSAG